MSVGISLINWVEQRALAGITSQARSWGKAAAGPADKPWLKGSWVFKYRHFTDTSSTCKHLFIQEKQNKGI